MTDRSWRPSPRSPGLRPLLAAATLLVLAARGKVEAAGKAAAEGAQPPAVARMMTPGPEATELARRAGAWTVTSTIRATPDAKPMVTRGLVAERRMVGLYLEEVMKPASGSDGPDFRRISYLTYSKVEGRWQYVSLDTRLPVGIMPAYSADVQTSKKLTLMFEPLAFVGFGAEVEGRMIRSNYVLTRDGEDHEVAEQFWVQADGVGKPWLAVQYDYTRIKGTAPSSGAGK